MPSASVVKIEEVLVAAKPWVVSDELWERIEPLLPRVERRFRYPGRRRLPDREALQGILFVLHTGIAWRHLPLELGFGAGSTCYRRLDEWQRAGVLFQKADELILIRLLTRRAGARAACALSVSFEFVDCRRLWRPDVNAGSPPFVEPWRLAAGDLVGVEDACEVIDSCVAASERGQVPAMLDRREDRGGVVLGGVDDLVSAQARG